MEEIIKIAAKTKSFGIRGNAKYQFALKNKNCGDNIKIEFDLINEKIFNFRYEGETCIYCQASAALLAKNLNKLTLQKLFSLKKQIYDYFDNKFKKENLELFDFKQLLKKKSQYKKRMYSLAIECYFKFFRKK